MAQRRDDIKATYLFTENVKTLLDRRHHTQKELADWCHRSEVWISKILKRERQTRMEDLDRIATFFGLATYQLFQPGISPLTERRRGGDRRAGRDRRVSHAHRLMHEVGDQLEHVRRKVRQSGATPIIKKKKE